MRTLSSRCESAASSGLPPPWGCPSSFVLGCPEPANYPPQQHRNQLFAPLSGSIRRRRGQVQQLGLVVVAAIAAPPGGNDGEYYRPLPVVCPPKVYCTAQRAAPSAAFCPSRVHRQHGELLLVQVHGQCLLRVLADAGLDDVYEPMGCLLGG